MPRPNYEDQMEVTCMGSMRDYGVVIGFGFSLDATEYWMVQRKDKTVFAAPAVQLTQVMPIGQHKKWQDEEVVRKMSEGTQRFMRTRLISGS